MNPTRGREKKMTQALGRAIREARRARGRSAMDIAMELDMGYDTILDWENGHREMMMGNFLAVCKVLGMKPSELMAKAE